MATPGYEVAHVGLLLLSGAVLRGQPLLILGTGGVESDAAVNALGDHVLAANLRVSVEHLVRDVPYQLSRAFNGGVVGDHNLAGLLNGGAKLFTAAEAHELELFVLDGFPVYVVTVNTVAVAQVDAAVGAVNKLAYHRLLNFFGRGFFGDDLETKLAVDLDDLVLFLFQTSLLSGAVCGRFNGVEFHNLAPVLVYDPRDPFPLTMIEL